MNPTEGARQEGRGVGTGDVRPVVRRVDLGRGPAPSREGGVSSVEKPSPSDLAGGMELTCEERALVDEVLPDITNREREVLFEIVAGGTNERVAERMGVKLPTLRTHLMRLNQKLGSTSKSDLVRLVTQTIVLEYRSRLFGSIGGPSDDRAGGRRAN